MSKTTRAKDDNSIPKFLVVSGVILTSLAIFFIVLILIQEESIDINTGSNQVKNGNQRSDRPSSDQADGVANLHSAVPVTNGSSLITEDGVVVNDKGQIVQNDAPPMSEAAPKLSTPVNPDNLMEGVNKLIADENGFSPAEFTVVSGEPVTLSLSSKRLGSRLVFQNQALAGLELPVPADYTMAKTFNAPAPGEYIFYQDMPGRISHVGKMIVVEND